MDVPPRNPLFDLRLDAQVLSTTLNCSSERFWNFKGRQKKVRPFFISYVQSPGGFLRGDRSMGCLIGFLEEGKN